LPEVQVREMKIFLPHFVYWVPCVEVAKTFNK
jgi:hypothetical protein